MTEATVPVPVELLRRLFDSMTLTRDVFTGDSVEVCPSGISALIDIKSLLPEPPKVGDVLTAGQIADLPSASVMRDEDGDVLVKTGDVVQRVTYDRDSIDVTRWTGAPAWNLANSYTITLVSLPRD